jgi:cell division septum initiation protein DivIVA
MVAPAEITPAALPRRLLGYERGQVDGLLSALRAGHEAASAERAELTAALAGLEARAAEASALERELRETILAAQRVVEARRCDAERDAAALVAAAQSEANSTSAALAAERDRVEAEIERLRELERSFRAQARALVEEALARLGSVETAAPRPEHPPAVEGDVRPPVPTRPAAAPLPSLEDDTLSFVPLTGLVAAEPASPADSIPAEPRADGREPSSEERGPLPPEQELGGELLTAEAAEAPGALTGRRRSLALSLGILAVGALIAVGIWQLASDGEAASPAPAAVGADVQPVPVADTAVPAVAPEVVEPVGADAAAGATAEQAADETPRVRPAKARLVLRTAGGDAWVLVRAGSAKGKILFEGFLYDGESRRFAERRLWLRVGDPTHLRARLNGEPSDLPPGTADLLATPAGMRTLSLG